MATKISLRFTDEDTHIFRSIEIVQNFLSFLEQSDMYYRFPFTPDELDTAEIQKQIREDKHRYQSSKKVKSLLQEWQKYEAEIDEGLQKLNLSFTQSTYNCVLTFYGPHGYFHTTEGIFVNVTKKSVKNWLETSLHELLHILMFEQTKELNYEERERVIDTAFTKAFGEIFPNHYIQNF